MNSKVKQIARLSIVCAMYVVLTIVNPFSYDVVQFRISEILMFLVCFRKEYAISLILGCLISNLFSPILLYDITFGTLATALACLFMILCKNMYVSTIFPILTNGLIVSLELTLAFETSYLVNVFWVSLGETVVMAIGLIIFIALKKKQFFLELIGATEENEKKA